MQTFKLLDVQDNEQDRRFLETLLTDPRQPKLMCNRGLFIFYDSMNEELVKLDNQDGLMVQTRLSLAEPIYEHAWHKLLA